MVSHQTAMKSLADMLAEGQVRQALRYLNGMTLFRFTALYRFDDDQLTNRYFFDRLHPEVDTTDAIPVEASYCIFVRNAAAPFQVADSSFDERVAGHAKQPVVRAYCGVPLVDDRGHMFGSVCHFDFEPRPTDVADVQMLEEVAPLLRRFGHLRRDGVAG